MLGKPHADEADKNRVGRKQVFLRTSFMDNSRRSIKRDRMTGEWKTVSGHRASSIRLQSVGYTGKYSLQTGRSKQQQRRTDGRTERTKNSTDQQKYVNRFYDSIVERHRHTCIHLLLLLLLTHPLPLFWKHRKTILFPGGSTDLGWERLSISE